MASVLAYSLWGGEERTDLHIRSGEADATRTGTRKPDNGQYPGVREATEEEIHDGLESWRRELILSLERGYIKEIEETLHRILAGGFEVDEAAGLVFDAELSLKVKASLLETLLSWHGCRKTDTVTIAWYFHHLGRAAESSVYLAKAVDLIPDQAWFLRAIMEFDPDAAIEALSSLDSARMNDPHALSLILPFLEKHGEAVLLARFAARLLELQPMNELAFRTLMALDPEAILTRLREAIRENPDDPAAWGSWAMAQLAAGREQDAFEAFKKAADLEPGNPEYLQGLIESDPLQACEFLEAYYAKNEGDSEGAGKFGRALIAADRKEEAFQVLLNALEWEPEDPEWMDLLLDVEPRRTCETLKNWAEKDPEDGLLQGILGRALSECGEMKEGFEAYSRAFDIESIPIWAHGMVESDPARAVPLLEKVLDLTPEKIASIRGGPVQPGSHDSSRDVEALFRPGETNLLGELGLALLETGNLADGVPYVEFALDSGYVTGRQESVLIGALGRIDPGRGSERLSAMASAAGSDCEAWGRVGDGYRAMGHVDRAVQAYEKARILDPTNEEWITAIRQLAGRGR
jgi:cytochrome c-type biogenesis protein CcmH/NrfG